MGGSFLTFFSGFGLGTILLPVFSLFFSIEIAIALTGVVHLLNSIFKVSLIGRHADLGVALRFGIPGIFAAIGGAFLLVYLSDTEPIFSYYLGSRYCDITLVKIVIAIIMIFFALMEIMPRLRKIQFEKDKLLIGGVVSGFFGGLSGHQGALRSAFLIKFGLSKEAFIATGALIAMIIDFSRISIYTSELSVEIFQLNMQFILAAILAAFTGAILGKWYLQKITINAIQWIVTLLIVILSILLGSGII